MGTGGCTSSSSFASCIVSTTLTVLHRPPIPSYYTAGTNGTFDNQFTHVLKGGQDPLDTYEYEGEKLDSSSGYRAHIELTINHLHVSYLARVVMTGRDVWAIDATILQMDYGNFLIYSSWDPNTPPPPGKADDRDQCLYIA
jgi:hypothetical protein